MKSILTAILLSASSLQASDLLSIGIKKQFEPIPNSVLTNRYAWVTVKYNGKATNSWAIRFLMYNKIGGPPIANDIYMTNYSKDFVIKPEYYKEMVWFLPSTEKQAFFSAELVSEK